MNKIKYMILTLGIVAGFGLVALPSTAGAINVFQTCEDGSTSAVCSSSKTDNMEGFIKTVVNTLLYIIAAVSVITIIIAGIRYTTSHGDAKGVQVAKDTLLYSVVGLVVSISAYAIVNFVLGSFLK